MNVLGALRSRLAAALADVDPSAVELVEELRPSRDARFGADYQVEAKCAANLGKQLGKPPREVAADLVARLDCDEICEAPEMAGPGFINLRLRNSWIAAQLATALRDESRLGIAPTVHRQTFVVDYSSPNVAKPMHVGHIRSTVIGDSLVRTLRFLGHRVISDNHIGDWGTQFGMILYGYKHFADAARLAAEPVGELTRLYRIVNQLVEYQTARREKLPKLASQIEELKSRCVEQEQAVAAAGAAEQKKLQKKLRQATGQLAEAEEAFRTLQEKVAEIEQAAETGPLIAGHPGIEQGVLQETAALHAGDPENRALWEQFLPACLEEMESVYERLGVSFDFSLGESFYHAELPEVVSSLEAEGLAVESDGAKCVFLEGIAAPMIVQKQDGAFLYATTDLATIAFRLREWQPDVILYVVDHRQSLHFQQLFAVARQWCDRPVQLEHVSFGAVLGTDGKPYKTRSGSAVGLNGLLDEAVERAYAIVCDNDDARAEPLLSAEERREVARRIGIGAVKYADLSFNRTSDYQFSYDKMLGMTGNTATYMQYSYARVRSIFAKGGVDVAVLRSDPEPIVLEDPAERALGLALLQFAEAIERSVSDYRPNRLTDYLFDTAGKYASFFEQCPVLKAETEALRISRLKLCDLTARTLAQGLELLGIEVVERM